MSDEDMTAEELEDDINHDWWTVVGFFHESWERWADHYDCLTPQMAEDMAQMDAKEQGGHLAVVAVFEGKLVPSDKYVFVDPEATSDTDMNRKLRELGYLR